MGSLGKTGQRTAETFARCQDMTEIRCVSRCSFLRAATCSPGPKRPDVCLDHLKCLWELARTDITVQVQVQVQNRSTTRRVNIWVRVRIRVQSPESISKTRIPPSPELPQAGPNTDNSDRTRSRSSCFPLLALLRSCASACC